MQRSVETANLKREGGRGEEREERGGKRGREGGGRRRGGEGRKRKEGEEGGGVTSPHLWLMRPTTDMYIILLSQISI